MDSMTSTARGRVANQPSPNSALPTVAKCSLSVGKTLWQWISAQKYSSWVGLCWICLHQNTLFFQTLAQAPEKAMTKTRYVDAFWWGKQLWCLETDIEMSCFLGLSSVVCFWFSLCYIVVVAADWCCFLSVFLFSVTYYMWVILNVDVFVVIVVVVVVEVAIVNSKWDYHTYYTMCVYMILLFSCIRALHYRFSHRLCRLQTAAAAFGISWHRRRFWGKSKIIFR